MIELTYNTHKDYLLPNLTLQLNQMIVPLGKYALLRKNYLKQHHPILYNTLILSNQLNTHLIEINQSAQTQLDQMIQKSPYLNYQQMNQMMRQIEETILKNLIYS
ncbi:TnpV protein [Enterococcus plantarum]|nr:TnpV protein [Enterococcus plantarum]